MNRFVSSFWVITLFIPVTLIGTTITGTAMAETSAVETTIETTMTKEKHSEQTEATRIVANGFIKHLFGEGDLRGAYDEFVVPDFIQHNSDMADGIEGHKAYFAEKAKQSGKPADWVNVTNMVIVDGDMFAVHHHAFTDSEDVGRVFVDIWRVEGGKIVEHWDVIQAMPADMAHSNGIACGLGDDFASAKGLGDTANAPTCGQPQASYDREESIKTVDGYAAGMRSGKDMISIITKWLTSDYKQHSPHMEDGVDGAIKLLKGIYGKTKTALPDEKGFRLIAEGDYVLFHRLVKYPERPLSTNVDIFRVRDGQISEHWDIKQSVPEKSANDNGTW